MLKLTRNHEARQKYPVAMPQVRARSAGDLGYAESAAYHMMHILHLLHMQDMQYMEHVQHSQHTQHTQYMEHVRIRSTAPEPESGSLPRSKFSGLSL